MKTSRPIVALTFDAGGVDGATAETLEVLRSHGTSATFFVTGEFIEKFPGLMRQIVADGHEVANHSFTHRDLTRLSGAEIREELDKTDEAIRRYTGVSSRPLMRMPYGSRDARVLQVVADAGYRSVFWALDGGDWRPGAKPGNVIDVLRTATPGDIVVQHCAEPATARALPMVLDEFRRKGLSVATVTELLRDEE